MKALAWRSLCGCLLVVLGACTGAATPSSSRRPPASVAVHSAATAARPTSAAPATMPSVVAVVTAYYRAVVARNYRRAFGYLAPGATGPTGHRLTLDAFLQLAHTLDGIGGPVTRFSIGASPPEVVMTLYRARYGPYHTHLQMTRTRHGWAISSLDRI
jgi:hypothetical protein